MKKEPISATEIQFRALAKRYKVLDRTNVKIIYQFCQFDLQKATKVLAMVVDMKKPASLIENLLSKPQRSEQVLQDLEKQYDKLYGWKLDMEKIETQQVEAKVFNKVLGYNFFQNIPNDCISKIMGYLDPYSFMNFGFTCSNSYKICKSEAQSDYYKILVAKVIKNEEIRFPEECRFWQIREYVLQKPYEFTPNTKNSVINNLRNYVWRMEMSSLQIQKAYFLSFGSYEAVFLRCPRINLNGYYVCRHKYVKVGEKNEKNLFTPIHVVYYYRYLRFLEDGSVIYHICNRKLKKENLMKFLSIERLNVGEGLVGQYIQFKEKLFMKATKSNEIFSYEFEIRSTENQINNELKVMKYTLDLVDDHHDIHQVLYQNNPDKQSLTFSYFHFDPIREENTSLIRAINI